MARCSVQLCMQLTISITLLSSFSSIFISVSSAGRADIFSKGVDPALKKNPAHMRRMRWLMPGVGAESLDGKMPVLHGPDVSSSSAVGSSLKIGADSQTAMTPPVGGEGLSNIFEAEEHARGPLWDIVGSSHVRGNIDKLRTESPIMAKSLRGFRSGARFADDEDYQHLQVIQKIALLIPLNIPALGMWQITDDKEGSFRSNALVLAVDLEVGIDPENEMFTVDSLLHMNHVNSLKRKALQADISPPGMWQGNDDQLDAKSGKRALLADSSPPGIWTDAEVSNSQFHKRRILADISPPGMWSDDGDDTQDTYHKRRLLGDISPPGMWQGSDDQLSDVAQK